MSDQATVTPCVYPGCRDNDGNPALTTDGICETSRHRYRRLLDWIVLDYVAVKATLPQPVTRTQTVRRTATESFGHPAEWASDLARRIADELNGGEDALREHCGDDPAPHPGHDETRRVAHAHRYFTGRFHQLCTAPGAVALAEQLEDLHRQARSGLGQSRTFVRLPTPCPECAERTLLATPGEGNDYIRCGECGHMIRAEHYGLLTRMLAEDLVDGLIEGYDAAQETVSQS